MENKQSSPAPNRRGIKMAGSVIGLLLVVLIAYYAGPGSVPETGSKVELVVYAYSIQEDVLREGIFPAFTELWAAREETELVITGVFGPSGTLAGQISLGAPADIAVFSSINHLNYLIISREVEENIQPVYFGVSPIVIVTRPGNPAGIGDFSDLEQNDLVIVQADPRSSGLGELSLLAEYGSNFLKTGDQAAGLEQIRGIWNNVQLIAPSARTSLALFELGLGDALITYEQEARLARERGLELEIVMPSPTLLTQPVAVAIERNISRSEQAAAEAFLDFLGSPPAREIFSSYHLRPMISSGEETFPPALTYTAADLGGWPEVFSQLIMPYWDQHILPGLSLGEGYTIYTTGNE